MAYSMAQLRLVRTSFSEPHPSAQGFEMCEDDQDTTEILVMLQ